MNNSPFCERPVNKLPLWGSADRPPERGGRVGEGRVEIREEIGVDCNEGGVVQTKV